MTAEAALEQRVTIIGPGRLGRSLALLLERAGVRVRLAGRGAHPTDGIVLLTVPDAAIAEVARAVPPGPAVLHCSGATDLTPVAHHHPHGSLHPLMTFPGPEVALPDLHGIPAAIAGDGAGLRIASELARVLGLQAVEVPGDRRLYHAAAVLAGNGATVLLAQARRALIAAGVAPDRAASLLIPLVLRSVSHADPDPVTALTGPIARGDTPTLAAHLAGLEAAELRDVARLHRAVVDAAESLLAEADSGSPDND